MQSTIELLGDNWRIVVIIVFYEYWFMSQEAFLLRYASRDTRRIDFPQVDG